MRKFILGLLFIGFFLLAPAPTFGTELDTSKLDQGVIGINYEVPKDGKYLVYITKGSDKISYPYTYTGATSYFPLQFGDGSYSIGVMKQLEGTRYIYVFIKTALLDLKDPIILYTQSIQNINFNSDMSAIKFATKYVTDSSTNRQKLFSFSDYLISRMTYDFSKIPTLTSSYVPNIEDTFTTEKGICYDYSSLLAAFLRSQGVPTKLVKGYSKHVEGYHAWNEIFINGRWLIVDTTVDNTLGLSTLKIRNRNDYTKTYEY